MTNRITIGNLQVDRVLYDFLVDEALPSAGVDKDTYFEGFVRIFNELTPVNKELLAKRADLQEKIDAWHKNNTYDPKNIQPYKEFLTNIGYLVPTPDNFAVKTQNVDREMAKVAGPQLVVPILNRRFAINAANARWGSLYDALYGTNAISDVDGAERGAGYNEVRGNKVIEWGRAFLDDAVPLDSGRHADVIRYFIDGITLKAELNTGVITTLSDIDKFAGYSGDISSPKGILLQNNGLYIEIQIDPNSPIGSTDPAGVKDIVLEAAVTAIMDFEDSVAAVDAEDKVLGYRNWLGLNSGDIAEPMVKNGKSFTRVLNPDRIFTAADGSELRLNARVFMFTRNVGHLMTNPAVVDNNDNELPEGILDALVTAACAIPGLTDSHGRQNSKTGSIYIVKPKQHGPEEVAFTVELFRQVEELLGLPANTLKIGIMDEERRTTVNLAACIKAAEERVVFINTGFLDRTGDEIHTSMHVGPMIRKAEMKQSHWMTSYEDWNVDNGLALKLPGKAQIGKGMWAMTELMAEMLAQKIQQPLAGASTAWVPSPTAATLHATHYHRVNVEERQKEIATEIPRATIDDLLDIPLASSPEWTEDEKRNEVDNSCQSILGYVVRWIDEGVGCSKVPDIHDIDLMEDRATLRISSQHLANWILHEIVSEEFVIDSLKRMAPVVDRQNAGDPEYRPMTPDFDDSIAWVAARDLILEGTKSPSGYTEPILHERRRQAKARYHQEQD